MKRMIYSALIIFLLVGLLMEQPIVLSKTIRTKGKSWIIEPRTISMNGKYQCIIAPLKRKYNHEGLAEGFELVKETLDLKLALPVRREIAPNPAGKWMTLSIKGFRNKRYYETLMAYQTIPIDTQKYTLDFNELLKNKPGSSLLDKLIERLGLEYKITVINDNKSSEISVTLGIQSEDYGRFGHFNYIEKNSRKWDKDIIIDPVWEHDHIIDLKETGIPIPNAFQRRSLSINKDPLVLEAFKSAFTKINADQTGRYQSFMTAFSLADGIYYPRHATNKNHRLSPHSWGIAIDIDSRRNWQRDPTAYAPRITYQNMILAEQVFKPAGFIWGGDWFTDFDPMHFEVSSGNGAAPKISPLSIKVETLAATTVRVSWRTDIESTSGVEYSVNGAKNFEKRIWQGFIAYRPYRTVLLPYSKYYMSDKYLCIHEQTKEHSVIITGLKPHASYRYRVVSADSYGNEVISPEIEVKEKGLPLKTLLLLIFPVLMFGAFAFALTKRILINRLLLQGLNW